MSLVDGQHSQFLWDGSNIGPGNTDHKPATSFTSPNGLSNGDTSCGNFGTDLRGRLNLDRHALNVKRLRPKREGEPWPQSSKSRISGRLQTTWARSELASIDTFSVMFNCPSARKPDQKRCRHPNELPRRIDEGPATLKTRSKLSYSVCHRNNQSIFLHITHVLTYQRNIIYSLRPKHAKPGRARKQKARGIWGWRWI